MKYAMEYKGYKVRSWGVLDWDFSDFLNRHPVMYFMQTEPVYNSPIILPKIMNIDLDEEKYPIYELHFEGDYKGSTHGVNLMSYQTEYEVL